MNKKNLKTLILDLNVLSSSNFGTKRKYYIPRQRLTNPCGICREEIYIPDILNGTALYTPCRHLFHRDCLCQWLTNQQPTCPTCRRHFTEQQVYTMCGRYPINKKRPPRIDIYGPSRGVRIDWDGNIIA